MSEHVELTFGHLWGFLRRGLIPTVVIALAVTLYVYTVTSRQHPTFRTQAVAYAAEPAIDQGTFGLPQLQRPLHISAYRVSAMSGPILQAALAQLGEPSSERDVDAFRHRLSVSSDPVANLLYVTATAPSAKRAADEANAVIAQLVLWDRKRAVQDLDAVIASLEASIGALSHEVTTLKAGSNSDSLEVVAQATLLAQQQAHLATAKALRSKASGGLALLQPAVPPTSKIAPTPAFNAGLAFLIVLFLAYGVLFIREMVDARVYTAQDMARIGGLPVLASIGMPRARHKLPAEGANQLRTSIMAIARNRHSLVLHVASADAGEDATRVAASLAESYAANGRKTLLVDANLRRPELYQLYATKANPAKTLSRVLRAQTDAGPTTSMRLGHAGHLHVLFDLLPISDGGRLIDDNFVDFLDEWVPNYDVVVVVTPPLLTASESSVVASLATGSLLVAKTGRATLRRVQGAVELLERSGARTLGLVAVVRRGRMPDRPAASPSSAATTTQVIELGANAEPEGHPWPS